MRRPAFVPVLGLPAFLGLTLALSPVALAGPAVMAPHKAIYALTLHEVDEGASVGSVDGAIYLKWTETCEGYLTDQRIVTRLWGGEGEFGMSDLTSNSFEARDFSSLRFNVTSKTDDTIVERFEGIATKGAQAKPGEIVYRAPRKGTHPLDERVIFPNELSYKVLAAARADEQWIDEIIFEGGEPNEVYRVVAYIGPVQQPKPSGGDSSLDVLDGLVSWPVVLSYYDIDVEEGLPRYEVRFRLFANGVSDEVYLDYGDFSVYGRLQSIELLAAPKC